MAIKLSSYPFLEHASDVSRITAPILEKFDLNYFQYLTVFKDGSFTFICNQPQYTEFVLEFAYREREKQVVFSQPPQGEKLNANRYYFLWEPSLPRAPIQMANDFGIYHGMTFVERFPDRYNMVAFASPHSTPKVVNTYLNHLAELEAFIQRFELDQKALIDRSNHNPFKLHLAQQDVFLENMLLPKDIDPSNVLFNANKGHITQQEKNCLHLLANGHTHKSIAKILNLSPRTVESYLNRVKARFALRCKSELLDLWKQVQNRLP